ncbi:MAG: hypothetical protein IH627_03050 [Rubrivivax sp.]|nr:hypothetical protein [Rubrivivax sp.]
MQHPPRLQRPHRALIGSGFFLPPATQPLPGFRVWERIDAQRVAERCIALAQGAPGAAAAC